MGEQATQCEHSHLEVSAQREHFVMNTPSTMATLHFLRAMNSKRPENPPTCPFCPAQDRCLTTDIARTRLPSQCRDQPDQTLSVRGHTQDNQHLKISSSSLQKRLRFAAARPGSLAATKPSTAFHCSTTAAGNLYSDPNDTRNKNNV